MRRIDHSNEEFLASYLKVEPEEDTNDKRIRIRE
jgi:hypothetical protein